MAMQVFSSHKRSVYKDQPVTCTFEPPTRKRYSSELGESVLRCSSVIALFASPINHAPTIYAAPVSRPYTTYLICQHYNSKLIESAHHCTTHTRQNHQIVIWLEISWSNHDPSCCGTQTNDHNGHRQKCECLCVEVTHGSWKGGILSEVSHSGVHSDKE